MFLGSGTPADPYIVEPTPDDPGPQVAFGNTKKWLITGVVTASVFAVTLTSSAYSSSANEIRAEFGVSQEIFALGIAL